ncbi:MAG: hypothetical protein ACKO3T_26095, partial [Planctomycetaceae bacterium]
MSTGQQRNIISILQRKPAISTQELVNMGKIPTTSTRCGKQSLPQTIRVADHTFPRLSLQVQSRMSKKHRTKVLIFCHTLHP